MKSSTADREIIITRLINAPRELVFRAFTELEHLEKWWGPRGFTVTTKSFTANGLWDFVMHGPDGKDYINKNTFVELVPPERLVYSHAADEKGFGGFTSTVTFVADGHKTRVTMHAVLASAAEYEIIKTYAVAGGNSTLDCLEELMATWDAPTDGAFQHARVFHAPRALVWKAWTEPERLAAWWGPKGSKLEVKKHELRTGGLFHYAMHGPAGTMYGRFIYEEITPPERLSFTSGFADDAGQPARAPIPDFPLEIQNTVTFTELEGRTLLTLRGESLNASAAERKGFVGMFKGMKAGFAGTFSQLEDYLKSEL